MDVRLPAIDHLLQLIFDESDTEHLFGDGEATSFPITAAPYELWMFDKPFPTIRTDTK